MTKAASTHKNIPLLLFLFSVAIGLSIAVVYSTEYIQWLFALLVLIGLVLLALRFPFYAFLLFIIALPFEAAFVIEVGFTIRPSYILLIIILLGLFFSGRKLRLKSSLNIPIFIFLGICSLSLIMTIISSPPSPEFTEMAGYRGTQLRCIIQLFFLFFFASAYFLTIHICSDQKKLEKILKVYIGIALLVSSYGVYQFFAVKFDLPFIDITNAISTSGKSYGVLLTLRPDLFRPHATFQEPLNFGNYILSIFPLILVFYLFKSKKNTTATKVAPIIKSNLFFILIFATALLLTKARGPWVGFVAALFIIFFLSKIKHKLKLISLIILALIFFLILIPILIPNQPLGKFLTYRFSRETLANQTIQSRILPSPIALTLWQKYPILGIGIGNYGLFGGEFHPEAGVGAGQSLWAQVLTELGILGVVALLFLVFAYCKIIISAIQGTKNTNWYPYFVGYFACFTGMMVQYLASFCRFPLYFWVFLGISMATVKLINKEEKK